MSDERAEIGAEDELAECERCDVTHALVELLPGAGLCPECSVEPPRTERDLIDRLERRIESLEERLDRLDGDREPRDERELGEASLG